MNLTQISKGRVLFQSYLVLFPPNITMVPMNWVLHLISVRPPLSIILVLMTRVLYPSNLALSRSTFLIQLFQASNLLSLNQALIMTHASRSIPQQPVPSKATKHQVKPQIPQIQQPFGLGAYLSSRPYFLHLGKAKVHWVVAMIPTSALTFAHCNQFLNVQPVSPSGQVQAAKSSPMFYQKLQLVRLILTTHLLITFVNNDYMVWMSTPSIDSCMIKSALTTSNFWQMILLL